MKAISFEQSKKLNEMQEKISAIRQKHGSSALLKDMGWLVSQLRWAYGEIETRVIPGQAFRFPQFTKIWKEIRRKIILKDTMVNDLKISAQLTYTSIKRHFFNEPRKKRDFAICNLCQTYQRNMATRCGNCGRDLTGKGDT